MRLRNGGITPHFGRLEGVMEGEKAPCSRFTSLVEHILPVRAAHPKHGRVAARARFLCLKPFEEQRRPF